MLPGRRGQAAVGEWTAGGLEGGLCTHTQVIISESEELEANLGAFVKFPT